MTETSPAWMYFALGGFAWIGLMSIYALVDVVLRGTKKSRRQVPAGVTQLFKIKEAEHEHF